MSIEAIVSRMTTEEKAAIVAGTESMYTNSVPRLGVRSLSMADGPHGLRKQTVGYADGVSESEPSTAFPTAAATASGWNAENLRRIGAAIADECIFYGVDINLGPAVNIKRNPRCGRNFEYFSEDPLLTGVLGGALAGGVQSMGVASSVKHFAANNSEEYRFMGDSVVDERALREIYLRGFERIVKDVKPYTVMCAYNRLNGEFCSENKWLLTDVLRNEWGFDGVVMSDWGAVKDRVKGIKAGLDLEMPGDTAYCRRQIIDAVNDGTLSTDDLDNAVKNILELIEKCSVDKKNVGFDRPAHHNLAVEIAADCAVLMKNDGTLPLSADKKVLVIGELFEKMRYQGAGSSLINSAIQTSPKQAFDAAGALYEYRKGYAENTYKISKKLHSEALNEAGKFDIVLMFAGLTDYAESEGCDRPDLSLPENQIALISALVEMGKRVVLVLFGGAPVEIPRLNSLGAILNMYLPGQGGGEAAYKLLYGHATPSGKLAESWPLSYNDVPYGDLYAKTTVELYKESIFVGYRYYQTFKKPVAFAFGHGLSYTQFEYSDLTVTQDGQNITAMCEIKNIGQYSGAEVVQLYTAKNKSTQVFKPALELRAFDKVYLNPGETKAAVMRFDVADLAYYNTAEKAWIVENGEYGILIGASCEDIKLEGICRAEGFNDVKPLYKTEILNAYTKNADKITDEDFCLLLGRPVPAPMSKRPLHIESRFSDLKSTLSGRILYTAIMGMARKQMRKAKRLPKGCQRDNGIKNALFFRRILESNSLRSVSMAGRDAAPYNLAEAIIEIANGHLIRGVKKLKAKINVPPLPKDTVDSKQ